VSDGCLPRQAGWSALTRAGSFRKYLPSSMCQELCLALSNLTVPKGGLTSLPIFGLVTPSGWPSGSNYTRKAQHSL
jgi:hypothetical protein